MSDNRLLPLLHAGELQFGFVTDKGYQKALFTLESVIKYDVTRGSPVLWRSLMPLRYWMKLITMLCV